MSTNCGSLAGKVLFITGASRGIGRAIAIKAARDGANVSIVAKTAEPHPKLPGTVFTVAEEVQAAGGKALPCVADIRNESDVQLAVEQTVKAFGGIDILVNNASAISLTGTENTSMKTYDLMMGINARGTFLCSKLCLPHLKRSSNPHILNISPPLSMRPRWFSGHVAYTTAKYGMSLCVLGMAEELRPHGVAVNALWPRTAIYTAAMRMLGGGEAIKARCRQPEIMADAAYTILKRKAGEALPNAIQVPYASYPRFWTGQFFVDDNVLQAAGGVSDLDVYACVPGSKLLMDFFLDEIDEKDTGTPAESPLEGTTNQAVNDLFRKIQKLITADLVQQTKACYKFQLQGKELTDWFIDLKSNGSGRCGQLPTEGLPTFDSTFKMKEEDFVKMFRGELSAVSAFMNGQMKIEGSMSAAMKLEKLMKMIQA